MLCLCFRCGQENYAVDVRQIAETIPMVKLRPLPQAPAMLAGVFNYRGVVTPVIDLSRLILDQAAVLQLSTRIAIVHYPYGDAIRKLGVIIEHATETIRVDAESFTASGINNASTPYLGKISATANMLQLIDIERLLRNDLELLLFSPPLEPASP